MTIKPITFTRRGRSCRECKRAFQKGDTAMRYADNAKRRNASKRVRDVCMDYYSAFMGECKKIKFETVDNALADGVT